MNRSPSTARWGYVVLGSKNLPTRGSKVTLKQREALTLAAWEVLQEEQPHGFCHKSLSDSAQMLSQVLGLGFHPGNFSFINVLIRGNVSNGHFFMMIFGMLCQISMLKIIDLPTFIPL